jgi:hypothetical protein
MKVTNEQLDEMIEDVSKVHQNCQKIKGYNGVWEKHLTALQELKALRAKPTLSDHERALHAASWWREGLNEDCHINSRAYLDLVERMEILIAETRAKHTLVPSKEEVYAKTSAMRLTKSEALVFGACHEWLLSRLKTITPDQWNQIREAWNHAQMQWYAHASGSMDFDGSPEKELYEENLEAFKVLDKIEAQK